jgi:hypothetical protein
MMQAHIGHKVGLGMQALSNLIPRIGVTKSLLTHLGQEKADVRFENGAGNICDFKRSRSFHSRCDRLVALAGGRLTAPGIPIRCGVFGLSSQTAGPPELLLFLRHVHYES